MDNKYLILLLFIFLVFLMGSINSSITNNFYNNSTGSQDHSNLSNLSYSNSNHTGFQSSDTLDTDVGLLGYITNATMAKDNTKVNKSGDNMTGQLSVKYIISQNTYNSTFLIPSDSKGTGSDYLGQFITENNTATFSFVEYVPSTVTGGNTFSAFRMNGTQEHTFPLGANQQIFWIGARGTFSDTVNSAFPPTTATRAGINLKTSSQAWSETNHGTEIDFMVTQVGTTTRTVRLNINDSGIPTFSALAGSGNDYPCLDSTGKIYRDPTGCS